MKKILAMLLTLALILSATSVFAEATPVEAEGAWDGAYMDEEDYKAYTKYDLELILAAVEDQLDDDAYDAVNAALEAGVAAIDEAHTVASVRAAYDDAAAAMANCIPLADGL